MRQLIKLVYLLIIAVFATTTNAGEDEIRKSLAQSMPSIQPDSIGPSEIKGLYEVMVGPNIFYMSDDGKYIIQGNLINVLDRKDISEAKVAKARVKAIDELGVDRMIVFVPKEQKHQVSIFTDIDCGYCRKLHSEIDQYLKNGIGVQYLFYPRAGVGSDSYNKAISVWCADDRKEALTKAKKGADPEQKTCDNPVDEHMKLGQLFGTKGTPMLVTEKGSILPGYVPADKLLQTLEYEKNY